MPGYREKAHNSCVFGLDRQTDRQTDRQIYRHTDIQTYRYTDMQTYRYTDMQIDIQTEGYNV